YIVSLAGEGREMPSPITVFGALNLNARNFEVELRRAAEKLENGMSGFPHRHGALCADRNG
ncbi:methionine sintase I, partial [human gut metagenome]